ncbi:MAG TPA: GNAT family N-acetyltransferase [Solirubrobacteraceae bacterium]|nr:GNAT family N-acetyltransferase [Solirubrobacteraceae bacterium]
MLIETDRLVLRPLVVADVDEVVAMHAMPKVKRTMGAFDRAAALARLERNQLEWDERGYGLVAIREQASGRFIGRSGLKYWPQFDETEVGWVLRADAWGHGFATEAGQACLDWGFRDLNVPYLTAMIVADNNRSISVARRLGMEPLRSDTLMDLPVVVYAIERPARS